MEGKTLTRELTDRTDHTVIALTSGLGKADHLQWCMAAVGGYGRRELCPHSDIDLLLLIDRRASLEETEKNLRGLLYPLWDRGFTVGYSVRTVKQALRDTRDDFFFRTALLDVRYLCGRRDLFDDLAKSCAGDRHIRDTKKFLQYLEAHIAKRHERYGDASYNLEPDIKEGTGSLRDYHCLMWVLKAASYNPKAVSASSYLTPADRRELEEAADRLLEIRYRLHELSGRKTDRLSFEYQKPLADKLGFRGNGNETSSELLMRSFHCAALSIKSIAESMRLHYISDFGLNRRSTPRVIDPDFRLEAGLISFSHPEEISPRPLLVLDIFVHMATLGASLSGRARNNLRESHNLISPEHQGDEVRERFLRILDGEHAMSALTAMLETGILERFIPEFATIKGRTQVDIYHTWTTDLHSIRTIHELHALEREEGDVFNLVQDREVLYFAAFIHDIGKGYGRPHSLIGASLAHDIAVRMGFPEKRADLVAFLVHHHLLLPDTAYRRDLSEEKVALECARIARDEQSLAMLYLLSVADSRATGPRAWDGWKASLLLELFSKALHALQRGVLRDPNTMIILEERWNRLIREVSEELGARQGGRLWVLPQAYVIHTDTELIKRHLRLSAGISGLDDITVDIREHGNHVRITIVTKDRPGLFAMMAGIFAMNHLDILSAQVFTWLDGIAVDTFHVVPPWEDYAHWDRITEHFRAACTGKLDIASGVDGTRPLRTESAIRSSSRPRVTLDNTFSDFFTLIDVHSPRRFGQLYRTARTISSLGLDIHRAFLSHTGDPCTDVFYVVDEFGEKITEAGMMKKVEQEIASAIE
ncbi:MAG TPA: [protein-PII] uridylyltransferase [Deltaproteobacteria bacterium]|nr:[protein-PII] uridylyltransferase [Deltaproteobacteria bacterium]HPR54496.1 [protein-PII] uridylyltransferase [Deltaproteobacteria bacterium]HXK46604.1 [protein-PII] uridylyltransferase [Deltaproteobacteria bacterium]